MMKNIAIVLLAIVLVVPHKALSIAPPIVIAVIDSGIDPSVPNLCKMGHKSFVDSLPDPLHDENGHGTHIASIIAHTAGPNYYCMVSIKYFDPNDSDIKNVTNMIKAIQYAINLNVSFINISSGGVGAWQAEFKVIEEALDKHINIVTSAGNNDDDLDKKCNYFPACYDSRLVVVGNLRSASGERQPTSNYGSRVNRWEVGTNVMSMLPNGKVGEKTGTSMAAAIATGKLVLEALKR